MNWLWINASLMTAFFAVWTGVPLWLSFRHPDTGPVSAASGPADDLAFVAPVALDAELVGAR